MIAHHKLKTVRYVENGRLVYFRKSASSHFWDKHWSTELTEDIYQPSREGRLFHFQEIFPRHLPSKGRLLEAGCGIGQIVLALRTRGYDCEGVDFAAQTIDRVRSLLPDLPVRQGDVTRLDVPDHHYQGYISLGVVEHRQDGPEAFLAEAHRVLTQDGVLLVSVPHFHLLRRLKHRLGWFRRKTEALEFYQQAFKAREMIAILDRMDFVTTSVYGYDPIKGIKDELSGFKQLMKIPFIGARLRKLINSSPRVRRHLGHMILFVCYKK